jgi:predicted RNA-binding Zn ribbon-like protein
MVDDSPLPRWAEHPAPEPLTQLQRFVNTHAYSGRPDRLATTTSARAWFRQQQLAGTPTARDVTRLVAAREAIRETLRSHDARNQPRVGSSPLELALPHPSLTWQHADDNIALVGAGHGLERFLNDLAAAIVSASVTGTWRHLKICDNDECHVAFWDHTRNGSARYCSSTACANRSRQRAFRARSTHP